MEGCTEQLGGDAVRVEDGLVLTLKIRCGGKYVVGSPPEAKEGIDDVTGGVGSACVAALEMED